MKKISIFSLLIIILVFATGCFDVEETPLLPSADETTQTYAASDFSIKIPRDWVVIERQNMRSDIPGEILAMFMNNVKDPFYTATIAVTRQTLEKEFSSLDFAKLMMQKHKDTVFDFEELGQEPFAFKMEGEDDVESLIFNFQGRETMDGDLIVIHELYFVTGKTAYTITAGHKQGEDEGVILMMIDALKSMVVTRG